MSIRVVMNMNEELLRLFIEVAELGSFSAAANNHWLSQRAVAQRMRRFEQQLGVDLFVRESNKLVLTSVGRNFLKDAKRLTTMMDQAYKDIERFKQDAQHQFSIGYFSQYNASVIQKALSTFENTDQIKTVKEEEAKLIKDVQQGTIDCAVINDGFGFNLNFAKLGLSSFVITTDNILMKCSQKFIHTDTNYFPKDLFSALPMVYTEANVSDYMKKALLMSLHNIKKVHLLKVDSFGQMQVMIANGQAISFCGKKLAHDEAGEGIAYLPLDVSPKLQVRFTLIFNPNNKKHYLRKLLDFYKVNRNTLL